MSMRRTPLDRLADGVEDQLDSLLDAALEGLLIAGIGVLAGTAAGKAVPVVVDQLHRMVKAPSTGWEPVPKAKRKRKSLASGQPPKSRRDALPASGEVIDLHPDRDGVYH